MIKSNIKSRLENGENIQQKARTQQRNGTYGQFLSDRGKYLPAEFQVVISGDPRSGTGRGLYMAFEAGEAEQLMTYENAKTLIDNNTEEVQDELKADINAKIKEVNTAISSANTATKNANTAIKNANASTTAANEAAKKANEAAENIKDAVGIDDTAPHITKTYSSNKIEDMAQVNWLAEYIFETIKFMRSTGKVENGIITVTSSAELTAMQYGLIDVDFLKKNTEYSLSWESSRTGANGGGIGVYGLTGSTFTQINTEKQHVTSEKLNFNTGEYEKIRFTFVSGSTGSSKGDTAVFWDIMLNEGENSVPYMKNAKDMAKEIAEIESILKNIQVYEDLDAVCDVTGITKQDYTAAEFLQALPRNTAITFTCRVADTSVHKITDLPVPSGIIFVYTGKTRNYNRLNVCSAVNKSDIYTYMYNSTVEDSKFGWEKMLSKSDVVNNFLTTDTTKVAAAPTVKQLKEEVNELNVNIKGLITRKTYSSDNIIVVGSQTSIQYDVKQLISAPEGYDFLCYDLYIGGVGWVNVGLIQRGNGIFVLKNTTASNQTVNFVIYATYIKKL